MVIIKTKDVGEVKVKFNRGAEVRKTQEDRAEEYIKQDMSIKD